MLFNEKGGVGREYREFNEEFYSSMIYNALLNYIILAIEFYKLVYKLYKKVIIY